MPTFKQFDIVSVPFPYTDRSARQRRPTLIIAPPERIGVPGLAWVVMITAAENLRWPDDIEIADLRTTGLSIPSIIRCAKVAVVEVCDLAALGVLAFAQHSEVKRTISKYLGFRA